MNIIEFLDARLAEDEQLARESHSILLLIGNDTRVLVEGSDERNTYRFIERFNPARVLREVAAKRALIAQFVNQSCMSCSSTVGGDDIGDCVARLLAAAYSDHPDFNPEWTE